MTAAAAAAEARENAPAAFVKHVGSAWAAQRFRRTTVGEDARRLMLGQPLLHCFHAFGRDGCRVVLLVDGEAATEEEKMQ